MIRLEKIYLSQIKNILKQYAPNTEVWAYGSRVNGTSHDASDLDLVIRNPKLLTIPVTNLGTIKQAFSESDLPIFVDLMDWASMPEPNREEILKKYVVIYP